MSAKRIAILLGSLCAIPALWLGAERLVSDAATRLAYQIRNEALWMRLSGAPSVSFEHRPKSWPEGITGDYRIEFSGGDNPVVPGRRTIGVARDLTEPAWYSTSYHLNYVEVPARLVAAHHAGEVTRITLERRGDKVLLTKME